jgi:outer membrane protein TolC
LLSAQDSLVSSELALAQARFDLALSTITFQRQVGTFPEPHYPHG